MKDMKDEKVWMVVDSSGAESWGPYDNIDYAKGQAANLALIHKEDVMLIEGNIIDVLRPRIGTMRWIGTEVLDLDNEDDMKSITTGGE